MISQDALSTAAAVPKPDSAAGRTAPQEASGGARLDTGDREGIALLASVLKTTGYPGRGEQERWGTVIPVQQRRQDMPLYLKQMGGTPALRALVKLFAFGAPVSRDEASEGLRPLSVEHAAALGIVSLEGDQVFPRAGISACDGLLILHERIRAQTEGALPEDHVLGISPPTLVLARLTVRQAAARALDLGTGCGVQALLAARHTRHVVGTDINRRALNFAEFNAALNGVRNVEFRFGSLFEPVAGEKFDLIVSNPPYVVSPESTYLFRDGGKTGDSFCEGLVRELPGYLTEGGFASMLCNWAHRSEEEWFEPVRRWTAESGCDCWVLHGTEHDPVRYAADWNRHRDPKTCESALDRWEAYYRELGIRSITAGGLVMRRRAGVRNWFRTDEIGDRVNPLDPLIRRVFASEDYLRSTSDEELLDCALIPARNHRIVQSLRPEERDYTIQEMRLESDEEPGFQACLDPSSLHLLRRCTGERPLREILAELARMSGAPQDECTRRGLEITRGFIAHGILHACGAKELNGLSESKNEPQALSRAENTAQSLGI